MTASGAIPEWPADRYALALFAALSSLLAALLVATYLQYILLAVVLAYILAPAQQWLEQHVRPMIAALLLISAAILVLLLPIAYILTLTIQQGIELLQAVQEGELGREIMETYLEARLGIDVDLFVATYEEPIMAGVRRLATGLITVIGGLPSLLIGLTITIFVLFALLRDGGELIAWLRSVVPIDDGIQQNLLHELDRLMWASVVGNVAVAVIQALLLGAGLVAVGMPGVVFLTVATFVLALLPLVGAFGVWVPVAIYLAALGRPIAAAMFVLYGSLVSVSDMYLRPAIIGHSGAINVAIIVVGIFGGIVLFGAIGLFIGPVILGGAKIVLDLWATERAQPAPA